MALLCQLRDFFAGGAVLRHRRLGRVRRAGNDWRSKDCDAGRNIAIIDVMIKDGGTVVHRELLVRRERKVGFDL